MAVNIHNEHARTVEDLARLCRSQHRKITYFINHRSGVAVILGNLNVTEISEGWYSVKLKNTKKVAAENTG